MAERILIYTFYFAGIELPMKVEAPNQDEARRILKIIVRQHADYARSKVISEFVESPVTNITTKMWNGKRYLYVGFDQSQTGWKLINE
jgi:hypothetical protein